MVSVEPVLLPVHNISIIKPFKQGIFKLTGMAAMFM